MSALTLPAEVEHRRKTAIDRIVVSAHTIPTDSPEADGTLSWNSTTIVIVRVFGGGTCGLGYTYGHESIAKLIDSKLSDIAKVHDAMAPTAAWEAMRRAMRNNGQRSLTTMAISAVDVALWDLKARLLDLSVAQLLGQVRSGVDIYGSGGFTSYSVERLQDQLAGWVNTGMDRVKMKIGSEPTADEDRVRHARQAIGPKAQLFVDANGAYSRKEALNKARAFSAEGVVWFEEPVSSDDLEGLRFMRDQAPIDIAAGEYGYDPFYFRRMLDAGAVDVLQADATRCGGITGFVNAAALCESYGLPLSAHCAPSIHAHPCCALNRVRHLEYFHDHVRIEGMLFDGALRPVQGQLIPDPSRPGLGLALKEDAAKRFTI